MVEDYTDFPIWKDCPFRHRVPGYITIRKGRDNLSAGLDDEIVVLEATGLDLFCDCRVARGDLRNGFVERYLKPMVTNLGGCVMEKEHPGYVSMYRERAELMRDGIPLPKELEDKFRRLEELTKLVPEGGFV